MSLDTALSPQPSAQPEPQQASSPPASGSPPAAAVTPPPAEVLTAPKPGQEVVGGNGGPDWRAMLAGEDTKALETFSRYKSPADVAKAFLEQRAALSKRAEPVKLTPESTPEQIAEYRKAVGVPDVAADAKPESFLEAYKVAAPAGYEMTDGEKALLGTVAQRLHGKHMPPEAVQAALGEYFEVQQAQQKQVMQATLERRKEWQDGIRDEIGSKEYDARQKAAKTWLEQEFTGKEDDLRSLLSAQLPGGGMLGDHPFFFNLIAEKAMGAGFTDRIQADAMESAGKSLASQQAEIEALQFKDRVAYDAAGPKLDKIIALRQSRGELDEHGNEVRRRRQA